MMIISPERVDPFAEGLSTSSQLGLFWVFLPLIEGNFLPWLCCCSYFKCHFLFKKITSVAFFDLLLFIAVGL
jgi:hypothetical protein